MLALLLAAFPSQAGSHELPYGVPDGQGTFSYEQRDLMTWVNAVRVAPTHWDDYLYYALIQQCSSDDFTADELVPKAPLSHDIALETIAAGYAAQNGTGDYDEVLGAAYDTGFSMTFNGWVCDPKIRAVLMGSGYAEAGTGVVGGLYTVNLATSGELDTDMPVVNASHLIDFSVIDGNPWHFVAPKTMSGGC